MDDLVVSKEDSLLFTSDTETGDNNREDEGELLIKLVTSSPESLILSARSGPILVKKLVKLMSYIFFIRVITIIYN